MSKFSELTHYSSDLVLSLGVLVILGVISILSTASLSDMIHIPMLIIFSLGYLVFMAFFWRGKHHDEREAEHAGFAGKVAYGIGVSVVTIAIVVQSYTHTLDPWILFTLGAMIVSRTLALMYARILR